MPRSVNQYQLISISTVLNACRETHLNGIYVSDNFPCSSVFVICHVKGFTISNINIIINFTMGFGKLDLGSREIVRHIHYIKSQLLGLLSLT